jgi:putative flavoprotein involved in K+ transport
VPALDARGELRHEGGVTPVPGLYAIGLPFLRRRKSGWLDGVGDDARELGYHLAHHLAHVHRCAA